ncbi:MAG: pyocin activator PrtN family protein, partial [Acinetobacter sp.]|nr:pyocin activator PrtN family protein [Acinetobacter sp.]
FMQFRTATPTLENVCAVYYPHLCKAKQLEKARKMEFPFICFRIDNSQKSPYLVDLTDLAFVLDNSYKKHYEDFKKINPLISESGFLA